jgi:hypothetical protein
MNELRKAAEMKYFENAHGLEDTDNQRSTTPSTSPRSHPRSK